VELLSNCERQFKRVDNEVILPVPGATPVIRFHRVKAAQASDVDKPA
jgi:hypothetical protein